MSTNKRITDLTDYTSVLPYASEIFGVYQPMIGWKSKRTLKRINLSFKELEVNAFHDILDSYAVNSEAIKNNCDFSINPVNLKDIDFKPDDFESDFSILVTTLKTIFNKMGTKPNGENWGEFLKEDKLNDLLNKNVLYQLQSKYSTLCQNSSKRDLIFGNKNLLTRFSEEIKYEYRVGKLLSELYNTGSFERLNTLFYSKSEANLKQFKEYIERFNNYDYTDPFLSFDPKKDVKNVSISPIGIIHLYRQYFFELDTFLGTPVEHVWLSPGSSVELIETSSRKTIVEKYDEVTIDKFKKVENNTTSSDEISEAVKNENRSDIKLGFSSTVNQKWPSGSMTATGNINYDKTQQNAREDAQKRMREQTNKLSAEIRQNFKSSLKTITEISDTSSKRYVLQNTTDELINYEMRRKMRQVGIQVQDIGTYLSWQTFVDNPGNQLGLPNLIHIAKPADLQFVANGEQIPIPQATIELPFTGEMEWTMKENIRQWNDETLGFYKLATIDIPQDIPEGYEVDNKGLSFKIEKDVIFQKSDNCDKVKVYQSMAKITDDKKYINIGLDLGNKGLAWDEGIKWKVYGSIKCNLKQTKRDDIEAANKKILEEANYANSQNQRAVEEAIKQSIADRVTTASKITKRTFETLREEERTIVYRNLIKSLMSENHYKANDDTRTSHVLSELLNSIFDIDKMLYFVAPEWWKPRKNSEINYTQSSGMNVINDDIVNWKDQDKRPSNYYITEESDPAPLGSSLGWLLQLDGDDYRNAFLNAPWVKAVIPIRPGKEKAAMAWLQNVGVEGTEGLDSLYDAPKDELLRIKVFKKTNKIQNQLDGADWRKIVEEVKNNNDPVTIKDALDYLCSEVNYKEEISKKAAQYPNEKTLDDDNKVLSTPLEKVFEYGFYPLKGSFKAVVEDYFEVISQWIEVLPTDQIVPVEVKYDPKTGRQI